ncbi:uncharacterized protein (DUF1697 family) [Wenyingzhuangia heitensis]|uniref:Uncharacterized protein (DUF1697 family) n=1 Tax=Wenyingzhuangia heitensis TaxID=1487859 RepID=A0ABX0UCH4_9FLAO|nr:DUF1697 domain-containing protein [Wenyingzhuangia heitensis]NIJ46044.1 uncharacterized protein (DUF1697 family) [Wenyingzhuangia heitensis]
MIYIVLLRGVNVAGKNKIIMKDFVNLLTNCDEFTKVNSYIQSGNFILKSTLTSSKNVSLKIKNSIEEIYGYHLEVFSYSFLTFKKLIASHPFNIETGKNYFVFTLNGYKTSNGLQEKDFGNDDYIVQKSIIHVKYATKYSDSKLNNNCVEKLLNTTATTRNYNTVQKLITMASA